MSNALKCPDVNNLKYLYHYKLLNLNEISKIFNVSSHTVKKWLIDNGIYERERVIFGMLETQFKNELLQNINNDLSIPKIASIYNTSSTSIWAWMKKLKIPHRRKQLRDKKYLFREYITNKKSTGEIAKELGVTSAAVVWYLKKFKIKARTSHQSQKLASQKRKCGMELAIKDNGSLPDKFIIRGYYVKYKDIYCMSAAELTVCLYLENQGKKFKTQPFTINRRTPDILVYDDNMVLEIKADKYENFDKNIYKKVAKDVKQKYGYNYTLINVELDSTYKSLYCKVKKFLKNNGAKVGELMIISKTIDINCL